MLKLALLAVAAMLTGCAFFSAANVPRRIPTRVNTTAAKTLGETSQQPTPAPTISPRACAGNGHRIWLRIDDVEPTHADDITGTAINGTERLLHAFVDDYLSPGVDGGANETAPFFTTVATDDVIVTDACGVVVDGANRLDVVITFVDGSGPGFVDLSKKHFDEQFPSQNFDFGRFRSNGELKHVVRSVVRHAAPIIGRIVFFVQTDEHVHRAVDNQTRALAAAANVELVVVRHAYAFPDPGVLPVFNSIAIETVLHRIPRVSPFFIYANDDTMLGRRLSWLDIVRPVLTELPHGFAPRGIVGDEGLVRLPMEPGAHAVSVMTKRLNASSGNVSVFIELEVIPYAEYRYDESSVKYSSAVAQETGRGAMNPSVAEVCGPLALAPNWAEENDMNQDRVVYSHARLMRFNRELVWNYLGVFQTHHDAHVPRLLDRALQARLFDGSEFRNDNAGKRPSPVLPERLVNQTRAARFRRDDSAGPTQLGLWGHVAESRRRHAQLLHANGAEWALQAEFACVDCAGWPNREACSNDVPAIARRSVLRHRYPKFKGLGPFTEEKLFAPVVGLSHASGHSSFTPEYLFRGVGSFEDIQEIEDEVVVRPRLWFAVNDHFTHEEMQLPEDVLERLEHLFKVATQQVRLREGNPN